MNRDPRVMEKARAKRLRRLAAKKGQAKSTGICFTQTIRTVAGGARKLAAGAAQLVKHALVTPAEPAPELRTDP